ncbi:AEX-3 domain-containing protein [Halteromyces radiatus]|uniref:AEX-3 domain-containing protein n=1 Tax=Halteromyces radiatus TaxID=101107 RepID=UPI0022203EC5|nr:AEX-3 domain-containing protein [Halteromyces radiatus]KAI8085078.1 AEX-3 domain-containing protein [Halteromyces radiatus]
MSISPAQQTVADYFFVTGLRDIDLLTTYNSVKNGQTADNEAAYYNNQESSAAATLSIENVTSERIKTPPTPMTRISTDTTEDPDILSNTHGRKRGQSLPLLPSITSSNQQEDSLTGMMDQVQAVIDHFGKERDYARGNVIAIPSPPSTDTSSIASWERSRRASVNTVYSNKTKRSSLYDTAWQHGKDTVKRTYKQRRQRQYSMSHTSTDGTERQKVALPTMDDNDQPTIPHLLDVKYPPTVLTRYPYQDVCIPFPSYLSMFSFPHDISLHYGDEPPPERIHSFAMTDDSGSTRYGTCCVFYEPLPDTLFEPVNEALQNWVDKSTTTSTVEYAKHLEEKIVHEQIQLQRLNSELASYTTKSTTTETLEQRSELEEQVRMSRESLTLYTELFEPVKLAICTAKQIWVPKSVGVLGRMPWLEFYSDWIKILLDSVVGVRGRKNKDVSIDVGSAVANLIHKVPSPPPGRFEIGLSINDRSLFISRPAMNEVPLLKNFSLYPVFRALSPHLILVILETLLAEGKVIFLSQHCGMLSLACESFRYLLFPFYWQFVFIPVLPERLLNCLQAPVPYIVGFQGDMNDIDDFVPEDACVVNLDSNTIHQSTRVPMLPERQRRKLQASIEQHCPLHNRCRVPYGVPLSVQVAFPNGRLLLSCNRSKLQDVFETPASRNRMSESSSDSSSLWSNSKMSWQIPRSSALWNSATSGRNSYGSFQSTSMSSNDLSEQSMPQLPSFAKLAINPQAISSPSSSSLHSPSASPISPTQASAINNRTQQQRSSMPATPKMTQSQSLGQNKEYANSPLYKNQNRMSEPPPLRKSTPMDDDNTITPEGNSKGQSSGTMSKPRATFQYTPEQHHVSMSSGYPASISSSSTTDTSASTGINYGLNGNYGQSYHGAPREISRHIKHIEGHVMVTLLPQELDSFQGFRCICGKHVDQETPIQELYRICQDCHLVTHDSCTDDILHPCLPACFDETKIQDSLLRMFASLLYGYRSGFMDPAEHPITNKTSVLTNNDGTGHHHLRKSTYFSKDTFLKHSDKDTRDFLSTLTGSQMFTQFITDRLSKPKNDPEILMFDEFIKLKLNRSKLKFVKEDTPFLNDDSYRVSQVIWTTPPESQPDRIYDRFPIDFSIIS